MTSYFADTWDDSITFGVQASNQVEVAQFSSTLDDVFVRMFTNNFSETVDNLTTGIALGSSNWDKSTKKANNFYIGHITQNSNIQKVFILQEDKVGINTTPVSQLHVYSPNNTTSNLVRVDIGSLPAFIIGSNGSIGISTEPISTNTVTIYGGLQVDNLKIGSSSEGDSALITTQGIKAPPGYSNLRFNNNNLSNINNIYIEGSLISSNTIVANNYKPLTGDTIQYNSANLSNITNIIHNPSGFVAVDIIKGSSNPNLIEFNASTLSNISIIDVNSNGYILTDIIKGKTNPQLITFNNATLSNISTLSKIDILDVAKITNTTTNSKIDMTGMTYSNMLYTQTQTLEVVNITTLNANNNINVLQNNLSNIQTLSRVSTIDVDNITTIRGDKTINMTYRNLSNIDTIRTTTTKTAYITAPDNSSTIDFQTTNTSNIGNLYLTPNSTLYTNTINPYTGYNQIGFGNANLNNIKDLNISGSITVQGEFFVMDTATCNTNQMLINNTGTGAALIVNQDALLANATVAEFSIQSNVAMMINKRGQVVVGSTLQLGDTSDLSYPAQLYVQNISTDNQDAVYIQQDYNGKNLMKLVSLDSDASNVVINSKGKIGLGSDPSARLHVYHNDAITNEFIRLQNNSNANLFVVGADGRVGLGTDPTNYSTNKTLIIKGIIQADNLVLGSDSGSSSLLTSYGMVAPSPCNFLSFGNMSMCNMNVLYPYQIQMSNMGTQNAPALTFMQNNTTGIYQPATNMIAFTTDGSEKLRIQDNGNVGIGTNNSASKLSVANNLSVGSSYTSTAAPVDGMIVAGNVGIGTTNPLANLSINGGLGNFFDLNVSQGFVFKTYTKSLSINANDFTNICTINDCACIIYLDVLHSESGSSESKSYLLSLKKNVTNSQWLRCVPLSSSGPFNSNDWAVDIRTLSSITTLRLVRISGSTSISNYTVTLRISQSTADPITLTDSSTTGSNATVIDLFNSSVLTQIEGNVGIGITNPVNKLAVSGGVGIGTTYASQVIAPTDGMIIAGNVGIGTSNVINRLDIAGATAIGSSFIVNQAPPEGLIIQGSVGVGTTSPASKFSVSGGVGIGTTYASQVTAPTDGMIIAGNVGIGTSNVINRLDIAGATAIGSDFIINQAPPEGLIIQGSVGIGTTSPASKFAVSGGVGIGSTYASQVTAPTDGMVVAGNVGIGTSNVINRLDIAGATAIGSDFIVNQAPSQGLIVQGSVGVGTTAPASKFAVSGGVGIGSTYASQVTAPTDGMVVAGNVGIGTSNVINRLDISGATAIGSDFIVNQAPPQGLIVQGSVGVGTTNPASKFAVSGGVGIGTTYVQVTAPTDGMIVSGTVGIGSSQPTEKLDVIGNLKVQNDSKPFGDSTIKILPSNSNAPVALGFYRYPDVNSCKSPGDIMIIGRGIYGASSNYLTLGCGSNSPSDIMTWTSDNKFVGIGSTNPLYKLDVIGTGHFTGIVNIDDKVGMGTTAANSALTIYGEANKGQIRIVPNVTGQSASISFFNNNNQSVTANGDMWIMGQSDASSGTTGNFGLGWFNGSSVTNAITFTTDGNIGIGTNAPDVKLNVIGTMKSSNVITPFLQGFNNMINVRQTSLSNIDTTYTDRLQVDDIISTNQYINVNGFSMSNLTDIKTVSLETSSIYSSNCNVSFKYNNIIEVDSIVVRSNITVTSTGLNTFTNLPTDLVRLDGITGKILDQYISSNIVRLMSDGTINPAMIPTVNGPRSTLLRTRDNVGIGLRNPAQKLHVYGNQCITGGRIGIGTTTPLSATHIWDDNSSSSSFKIENWGTTDTLEIFAKSQPLLHITSSCNIGIRNSAPSYELDVTGTIHATNAVRTNAFDSDTGTINCRNTTLSNIQIAHMYDLQVTNSVSLPSTISASLVTKNTKTDVLSANNNTNIQVTSALNITNYDSSLYTGSPTFLAGDSLGNSRIAIKADDCIIARSFLTSSDQRIKENIQNSDNYEDLSKILQIDIHKYEFIDPKAKTSEPITGFIAQELEKIIPNAVKVTTEAIPNILKKVKAIDNRTLEFIDKVELGDRLKIIIEDTMTQYIVHVNHIVNDIYIKFEDEIEDLSGKEVFVYGKVVEDFKMIDSDKLVPVLFSAVKQLHKELEEQKDLIKRLCDKILDE